MKTTIRPYQKEDKEACILAFKSNMPLYFVEEELPLFDAFLDKIVGVDNAADKHRKTYYYVLLLEDKLIACGGFGYKEGTEVLTFAWGLVHNDYHKMGYGKSLAVYRLEQIKKIYPTAEVLLDTSQHTFTFFEKLGFQVTKITKDFYAPGLDRYDMVLK